MTMCAAEDHVSPATLKTLTACESSPPVTNTSPFASREMPEDVQNQVDFVCKARFSRH